ncbi:MAG: FMN-binding protein [Candidatus Latescibacteria bacterium]|nr:FMN-binding protein [Candidatus Latescibacterota bacterium]
MKSLSWMAISLFIVCLIAAGLLSRVYTVTKIQIEKQKQDGIQKQLSQVLPEAVSFRETIDDTLWLGFDKDNQQIGIVFRTAWQGYAGPIPILVGLGNDTVIRKIYIASAAEGLKETPGLGFKIRETSFLEQFYNKMYKEIQLVKDGGTIHAITASTISSNAVINGIRAGIERFQSNLDGDTNSVQDLQIDTTTGATESDYEK